MVEYTSGGRVVAGSSPVIPTNSIERTAFTSGPFCFIYLINEPFCFDIFILNN